jgi:serine/threonine-protein kinase
MRRTADTDLVAGALALAYKYAGLPELRSGLAELTPSSETTLVDSLEKAGKLSAPRAEKLKRAARLACLLRDEAVYGMIALRNRIVGTSMLNACMEESRRTGFKRTLSELLLEKGVITGTIDHAIGERRQVALAKLNKTEDDLLEAVDLAHDDPPTAERKLAVLFGEVATKLMFLTREELEECLKVEERVRTGLPAEETSHGGARAPEPADAVPEMAIAAPEVASKDAGSPSEDEPIKGYQLLERLGVGAMGAVLKATKKDTGEVVALKILKPELAKDQEFVQRFNREALAVQALNHPNIIRAVQIGKSGDYHFFAMEFVDGETASKIVKSRGKLPERLALSVTRQIASALEHAWKHRIIHRDIKPDNIMITRDGTAKLTDLGLARTVKQESTLTITGVVMGSPAYISPEQATGEKNLDTRSDIYALGASLYHMIVGAVPYDGDSPLQVMLRHMNDPLPDVRKADPQISEGTRRLIFKMMAKRPEGRFQSPRDLFEAVSQVERYLQGGPAPAFIGTPVQKKAPAAPGPGTASPGAKRPAPKPAGQIPASTEDARRPSSDEAAALPEKGKKAALDKSSDKAAAESAEKRKELGERLRKIVGKKRRP